MIYESGAKRDNEGKYEFIEYLSIPALYRYAKHMQKAAIKYGSGNWLKGMPQKASIDSLYRHVMAFMLEQQTGVVIEPEVDHASAILFNIQAWMHEEELKHL